MKSFLLALALGASPVVAAEMFPFQLPWDDATPSATDVSFLNDKPAGGAGFITVKDGHLFAGEKRFRIFGVNTCFAADFPDKDMAPKIAARMAKFGINCVRFHHMDMMSAPGGIWAKDGKTLDPGQLDRLDWFIAKLKENGIYADLNLHVSRTYPDRPREEKKTNPDYDKGVDNYCGAMIAMQKDYARQLLTHVNAYTGTRYAEEPAVALVEINNENSLGFEWWAGQIDDLAEVYRSELEGLWTKWLVAKYAGTASAKADLDALYEKWTEKSRWGKISDIWKVGARLPGAEMLWGGGTWQVQQPAPGVPILGVKPAEPMEAKWFFEQHEGAVAKGEVKGNQISFQIDKPGTAQWHCQFSAADLSLAKGERYEVRFRVKAPKETSISVTLMQSHEPWGQLGNTSVKAGPEWREVTALLSAKDADPKARLTIGGMGLSTGLFEFSDFSLHTAPMDGEVVRDALGHVSMVKKSELSKFTTAKQRDWQEFLWDTEISYWNGMRDFLKKELGVHAPIVGTQGFWSPGFVQAGMDVIDSHAYWHHPDFLGHGWNADIWTVKNEAMAGDKDGGTLPGLAAQRVAGKPFICTEYNESAPNTHGAETFPLVLSFAALQDWDGVFAFSYCHRGSNEWGQEFFNNFFDIDRHPVKMATLPGAVLVWRRGDLAMTSGVEETVITTANALQTALRSGPGVGTQLANRGLAMSGAIAHRFEKSESLLGGTKARMPLMSMGEEGRNNSGWHWLEDSQSAALNTRKSKLLVGRLKVGETVPLGDIALTPGESRQAWACYQITNLDSDKFASAKRILITATGDVENTGMSWKNAEKTTVGRDWGKAPVLVEGPAAKIEIPGEGKLKAWALDERGQRRVEVPVKGRTIEIGPEYKTLWYEVVRE